MFMWIKKNECHSKPKHAEVSLLLFAYYKEGYSAAFASTTCNFTRCVCYTKVDFPKCRKQKKYST